MTGKIQDPAGIKYVANNLLAQLQIRKKISEGLNKRNFLLNITNSYIWKSFVPWLDEVQDSKSLINDTWTTNPIKVLMNHDCIIPGNIMPPINRFCISLSLDVRQQHLILHWKNYEEQVVKSLLTNNVAFQSYLVLTSLIAEASLQNKGNAAGKYGKYKLGALNAPFHLTPKNIKTLFSNLQNIFKDNHHWEDDQMFFVIPNGMLNIPDPSDFNKATCACERQSKSIDGKLNKSLGGFTIYESSHLPSKMEGGNRCFYMIAGHKAAYAYASDVIGERVLWDTETWNIYYQLLAACVGAMLYPERIAVVYGYYDQQIYL
ncbi:MAG: hypothetical protein LBR53_02175 [Deltaproteobacteria bacterium]|jgi:hypothetical protein|nr:hypothetical protein [Deltaproteobacteria bacterium]